MNPSASAASDFFILVQCTGCFPAVASVLPAPRELKPGVAGYLLSSTDKNAHLKVHIPAGIKAP